jgi:hypothetical protein
MSPAEWNPKWDDYRNMVWQKLERIEARLGALEKFRWRVLGGLAAVVAAAEIVGQFLRMKGD